MKKRKEQFENPYFDYNTNQYEQQGNQYDYNAKKQYDQNAQQYDPMTGHYGRNAQQYDQTANRYERNAQQPYDYNAQQYAPNGNPYSFEGNAHEPKAEQLYARESDQYGFGTEAQIPDYPFSDREARRQHRAELRAWRYANRRRPSAFVVVLCVVLSLVAGFAGSIGAMCLVGQYIIDSKEDITTEDVLCDDPHNEIVRPDPNPSIFGSAGEDAYAVSGVVHKVQDAVVVIDVTIKGNSPFGNPITTTGAGSGVIISDEGYILTCHHVIDGATTITVTLRNGNAYTATLVGSDEMSDLAVLKIFANETLTFVEQGHSADLVAGEQVVAIGNPLGTLGGTVTVGYISATERTVVTSDGTEMTLIQTDAAINSGNSGGGLFNLAGQLIGIVSSKYSASGVEGLAFAIPIDSAYPVQLDLMQYGYVRGVIDHGLTLLDITEENLKQYHAFYGIDKVGVYVVESIYATDLKNSDRILSVNNVEVNTIAEVKELLKGCKVGDTLTIVADRKGETVVSTLTLQEYVPDRIKNNQK